MNRRRAIRGLLLAGGALFLLGHTPYRQWDVYRKAHLLIGCHKADPVTYALAKRTVALLADRLPEAKARVARAPHPARLASLLGTAQLEVAILSAKDAAAMAAGAEGFAAYGALPLRGLSPLGARLLIAHADLSDRHAWLITAALADSPLVPADAAREAAIPWHPGSRAFLDGRPMPPTHARSMRPE